MAKPGNPVTHLQIAAITSAAASSQVVEWYQPQMKVYISMVRFPAGRIRAPEEPQRWRNRSGASSLFVFDYLIITNPHSHL